MFHPRMVYKDPEANRSNSFIEYVANRVLNNNKNFLCAVTGQTGAGKSWFCGAFSEKYSKITNISYNPNVHIFFTLEQFLKLLNSENRDEIIPVGSILQFEEPQVSINARKWQSQANSVMNALTSTFRNRRLVVLFSTPSLNFLDKQTRILFHAEIQILSFDKTNNYTLTKPRFLEWVESKSEFYRKRLIVEYPLKDKPINEWYFLQEWEIYKPSKEWVDIYEPMKTQFTDELNKNLQKQLEFKSKEEKDEQRTRDFKLAIELYKQYQGNFVKIFEKLPHIPPETLEKWLKLIKKSL